MGTTSMTFVDVASTAAHGSVPGGAQPDWRRPWIYRRRVRPVALSVERSGRDVGGHHFH
ncbi:MAG: hypothetical protein IPG06_22960 [Haliea sp.]|nr:hypothetical protein [Haliea sp.]